MPITVAVSANNCSRGANNWHNAVPITVTTPKKWPITVAFATFHFKNSLQISYNKYKFKNYIIVISYIFCISSYKKKPYYCSPHDAIVETSVRVG